MSGVEALEQTPDTSAAVAEALADTAAMDKELDSIWDRAYVTNGADRGDDGKFVSTREPAQEQPKGEAEQAEPAKQDAATDSLEGETAEGQDGSTPAAVPLPPNWQGKADLAAAWEAIPTEQRSVIAQHEQELHSRLSDMGRQVSQYKPLQEAASEFAEYFNGNLRGADGQPINPADGVRYLANIQRMMDTQPLETLMSIADSYGLREQLAKAFGGEVKTVPADQQVLLREIAELKQHISRLQSPANVEEVIERRELQAELSRFAQSKPLWSQVEPDLPFFINKAKTQLGEGAGRTAILDRAYELAVQADPALRAQTEAAQGAATKDVAKAEAAKRANGVNVTSTSTGKPKQPSLDDELDAIWDKHRKT